VRLALAGAMLLAGCGAERTPEQRAVQVAYEHAQQRFRYDLNIEQIPPSVEDRGSYWLVTFHIPPDSVGGAPMVEVRKSDMTIVGSVAGQ
jgi:hypothetical protein